MVLYELVVQVSCRHCGTSILGLFGTLCRIFWQILVVVGSWLPKSSLSVQSISPQPSRKGITVPGRKRGNKMSTIQLPKVSVLLAMVFLLCAGCGQQLTSSPQEKAATGNSGAVLAPLPNAPPASLPNFIALVKNQGPAVVNISSTKKIKGGIVLPGFPGMAPDDPFFEFFRHFGLGDGHPQGFRTQSLGSGFIIDQEGHILTNTHVVEEADEVTVGLTDKRELKAKVVGTDKRSDVALLKISARDLPVAKIGDSSKLEVGEWVVAIGAPFGFANTVTQGIVSAKGRDLPGENIVPFIQTDVAINPGSSGGPLFNMNGEVVGINSQIYSRSGGSMGISFAIPIDVAMKVKEQLLKYGTVKRGKLGVTIQNVTPELAETFNLEKAGGALVASVERGGPADRAGLRSGDVILAFDGKEVSSSSDLSRLVSEAAPGTTARLKVWRDRSTTELVVMLGEAALTMPEKELKSGGAGPDRLGLSLRELTRVERQSRQTDGVIIVEAVEGIAAASGIQPGDVILSINNRPVASIEQLRKELSGTGKRVALLIQRDAYTKIFITLNLKEQ
jgi:serine protease Do